MHEHSRVKALHDIRDGEELILAGSIGTIVHVMKNGLGYEVEFTEPKHAVVGAGRRDLAEIETNAR